MKIQTITKFKFKGEEFNNLKEVQDKVHNIIGEEVLDTINKEIEIKHKDLLKLFEILCKPKVRAVLIECLNVEIDTEDTEFEEGKTENILDLNFRKK